MASANAEAIPGERGNVATSSIKDDFFTLLCTVPFPQEAWDAAGCDLGKLAAWFVQQRRARGVAVSGLERIDLVVEVLGAVASGSCSAVYVRRSSGYVGRVAVDVPGSMSAWRSILSA